MAERPAAAVGRSVGWFAAEGRRRRPMALAVVDDGGPEELQHNFNVERRSGRKRKDGRTGGLADRQQRY